MTLAIAALVLAVLLAAALYLRRRIHRQKLDRFSISAEELHASLSSGLPPLIFDVRLPLDVLADPNVISDAQRVSPADLIANPTLIPHDRDTVVYCTCPGEETSRKIIDKALKLNFNRVKFLRGGLAAWRALGFPIAPYVQPFHLDTGSGPSIRS